MDLTRQERLYTIAGLIPSAREPFARLIAQAEEWGYAPRIIEVRRTCDEQRWSTTSKVKERSWHVLGGAVDLELHGSGAYRRMGEWWEGIGGTWGGRWTIAYPPDGDQVHFQWSGHSDGIPDSVWPAGEACDSFAPRYLARQAPTNGAQIFRVAQRPDGLRALSSLAAPLAVLSGVLAAQRAYEGRSARVPAVVAAVLLLGGATVELLRPDAPALALAPGPTVVVV